MNTSRFFRYSDPKCQEVDGFVLPSTWWSRPFEYAWAMNFVKEGETVLDAGCGIEHPFKFYLGNRCNAFACDIDKDLEKVEIPRGCDLQLDIADMTNLPYSGEMFDKVFCISVLEHLSLIDRGDALVEFHSVLKHGGKLILTLDYPGADPQEMAETLNSCGFVFEGQIDLLIPDNAIKCGELRCYRMVLRKV